ncbi:MAG: cysteine synthase A [Firmicutes bacterium HGW-Firmicutes-12]|nr:MAG: cysteine synthase A [Firmicutes bacterium HGW-Firmicutes-12]
MIVQSITDLIGNTPMLELNKLSKNYNLNAKLLAKLEYFNPGGSVKDRVGYALIDDAEKRGSLGEGSILIEPTSGNTGIGLAIAAAVKGYRLILTMPETMSVERRRLLHALGAEVVLTPGSEGMDGAINKAEELSRLYSNSYVPQQFVNPANPAVHRKTTGPEIWKDTEGLVDIFIAGVGTGGTITGAGEFIKEKNPAVKIVAVEPAGSPVLSGGERGTHRLQGIGAGFIPDILNHSLIDEVITVNDEQAYTTCRELGQLEGLLVGISSGAAAWAALQVASRLENKNKRIVVLLPDGGDRYLSVEGLFADVVMASE